MRMPDVLYIQIDDPAQHERSVSTVCDRFNAGETLLFLYGRITQEHGACMEVVRAFIERSFAVYIEIELPSLPVYVRDIHELKQIVGLSVRVSKGHRTSIGPGLKALKSLSGTGKSLGIKILYQPAHGVGYLEDVFRLLEGYDFSDLIVESAPQYIEQERKDAFLSLFLKYKDFLKGRNFQCTFIDDFRPRKCLFLEPDSRLVVLREGTYTICPYMALKNESGGEAELRKGRDAIIDDVAAGDQVPLLNEVKRALLKRRMVHYSRKDRRFYCRDCIREAKAILKSL